jgi:hypothetical protein
VRHESHHTLSDCVVAQLVLLQEPGGHVVQGLLRPREEPVDDGAVHQRWELTGSAPQGLTHGREAQRHVQVLLDLVDEVVPAVIPGVLLAGALDLAPDCIDDGLLLLVGVQLCDFARREQIVDVDQEPLIGDLPLGEEEEIAFLLHTGLLVEILEVVFEVAHVVGGADGDLEGGHEHHEGGQP